MAEESRLMKKANRGGFFLKFHLKIKL